MPSRVRRRAIVGADGPTVTPRSTDAVKRPHKSGSRISTHAASEAGAPPRATDGDESVNDSPYLAARSRATPATDIASGRFGLISRSHRTSSVMPRASLIGVPGSAAPSPRMRMPAPSSDSSSSFGEHSIPSETSPSIFRRPISRPSGINVPTVASGTRSPMAMLKAPHQTSTGSGPPASTVTRCIFLASAGWRVARTRATTMPSRPRPRWISSSTAIPSIDRSWPMRSTGASIGANSRSQESKTFIAGASELPQEADVVGDQVAHVIDLVARDRESVDAEAERKALPLVGVEAAVGEDVRVDHAAPAELEERPVGPNDVELGRRLGEREVRRAQPRRERAAEEGLRELVDRAGEVGERDAAVDDEALDLVEHREVGGVGRVLPEHPARHDGVDRRRLRRHDPHLHRRGVGAQHRRAGCAELDVERVVHVASRVVGWEVEGAEVVPVRLDLGPLGNSEPETDEDVLESFHGLGHKVEVAELPLPRWDDLGEIEALGFESGRSFDAGELVAA